MKPIDETISNAARDTAAGIKSTASDTVAQVKDQAEQFASRSKDQTADKLDSYGKAVHETASGLEQEDPNLAWLSHQAADRIEQLSGYVRSRSLGELRQDAERFARKHPAALFGGLFVAGLVVGNILKASAPAELESDNHTGNNGESDGQSDNPYALADLPAVEG